MRLAIPRKGNFRKFALLYEEIGGLAGIRCETGCAPQFCTASSTYT